MTQSEQKVLVANTAIDTLIKEGKIFSGMKIGLGTGSTAMPAVKRLAEHINSGELKELPDTECLPGLRYSSLLIK